MRKLTGKPMTEGAPWRHVMRFAIPVFTGALLQQLYSTVDMVIVGRFTGEGALSAVGTTGSFIFLLLAVALGISAGNGVVVAQRYGAEDAEGVRANAATGLLLMTTLGIAATILGLAVSRIWKVYLTFGEPIDTASLDKETLKHIDSYVQNKVAELIEQTKKEIA